MKLAESFTGKRLLESCYRYNMDGSVLHNECNGPGDAEDESGTGSASSTGANGSGDADGVFLWKWRCLLN